MSGYQRMWRDGCSGALRPFNKNFHVLGKVSGALSISKSHDAREAAPPYDAIHDNCVLVGVTRGCAFFGQWGDVRLCNFVLSS